MARAAAWFLPVLIDAIVSKVWPRQGFSAEQAAKTLAGYTKVSLSRALIFALLKGLRLAVFLSLPAIVWQRSGPVQAIKKGGAKHPSCNGNAAISYAGYDIQPPPSHSISQWPSFQWSRSSWPLAALGPRYRPVLVSTVFSSIHFSGPTQ